MAPARTTRGQMKIDDLYTNVKSISTTTTKRKSVAAKNENCPEFNEDKSKDLAEVKRALYACAPSYLPRRDKQIEEVYEFISHHLKMGTAASMYISGAPGTGKTAVVQYVLKMLSETEGSSKSKKLKFLPVYVNCMNVVTKDLFTLIYERLKLKSSSKKPLYDQIIKRVTNGKGEPVVLILDEMDQMLQSTKEVMYKLFELVRIPDSKLILIGIANALDLTARHLPMLTASPKTVSSKARTPAGIKAAKEREVASVSLPLQGCKLLQFPPYKQDDIQEILTSRMHEVGNEVFESSAIRLVASKVASTTGDMRKALSSCQQALDVCARTQRPALKTTADDGFNASSPKKLCVRNEKVDVVVMSKAIVPAKEAGELPLQQRIILACLLKINKDASNNRVVPGDGVDTPIPLNSFYDIYRKVCDDKGLSWIDRSELSSILSLLEDRSFLQLLQPAGGGTLKRNKGGKAKSGIFVQVDLVKRQIGLEPDQVVASIVD